jgi:CheY-like chemotaxis protein/HPt (histidine-containing phosphotransfer) domain-containing protein
VSRDGILLVDEQTGSRDLILLVLGKLGYDIQAVGTGAEALDRLARASFGLVLLSSTVPGRPGAAAIRRAQPAGGAARGPAIVLMGSDNHPQPGDEDEDGGVEVRLTRPVEIDRLLHWVKRLTDRAGSAAGAGAGEPVIDLAHLSGFTDGDLQLESELAELYLSSAGVYLERMEEALAAGGAWRSPAHALKGSSANLGARRVASLARDAEHEPPAATRLAALREAVEEVARFFARRKP